MQGRLINYKLYKREIDKKTSSSASEQWRSQGRGDGTQEADHPGRQSGVATK